MSKKLSSKQKDFCENYLKTGNAMQSAISSGYSQKYAKANSHKLLENIGIKAYIKERQDKADKDKIADSDEVLRYLTRVMRGEEEEQFDLGVPIQEKTKAAQLLGKRYGLFTETKENKEQTINVIVAEKVDKDDF